MRGASCGEISCGAATATMEASVPTAALRTLALRHCRPLSISNGSARERAAEESAAVVCWMSARLQRDGGCQNGVGLVDVTQTDNTNKGRAWGTGRSAGHAVWCPAVAAAMRGCRCNRRLHMCIAMAWWSPSCGAGGVNTCTVPAKPVLLVVVGLRWGGGSGEGPVVVIVRSGGEGSGG